MSSAEIVLVTNIAVASVFAISYLIVALTNGSERGTLWFCATYLLGMMAPLSDFVVPFSDAPGLFEFLGYASFLGATLAMSASFSNFHRRRPPWRIILAIFIGGLVARVGIRQWPRDTLGYGFAYQLPLAIAALLAARTVLRVNDRTPLHVTLAVLFGAIAVDLALKPFLAKALGSGATLSAYSSTTYALVSQASTGILLLAAGMILLLIITQRAITASQHESETDLLSGVANRRGFYRQAHDMLAKTAHHDEPVSVAVFDLDYFKRINDTYGHEAGDAVIARFGALLRSSAPPSAILGRMGGEEFAMMIRRSSGSETWIDAEKIRLSALRATREAVAATVSGGVAERRAGESLADMMRRADQALYQAKSEGRDRICLQVDEAPGDDNSSNILPFSRSRTLFTRGDG